MPVFAELRRMLRFFSVSVICTALDATVGLAGVNALDWSLPASVVTGFLCGLATGYVLHRAWTFQSAREPGPRTGLKFLAASAALLGLRLVFIRLAYHGMDLLDIKAAHATESAVYLLMLGVSFFLNYGICRRWVFRAPE